MRWEGLFADLEGRFAAEERRELDDEVAERTRRERALVTLADRLAASVGSPVRLALTTGTAMGGTLLDLGAEWLLVRADHSSREVVVPLAAVRSVTDLSRRAEAGRSAGSLRIIHRIAASTCGSIAGCFNDGGFGSSCMCLCRMSTSAPSNGYLWLYMISSLSFSRSTFGLRAEVMLRFMTNEVQCVVKFVPIPPWKHASR